VVFHEKYFDVYSHDPASAEGRLDHARKTLRHDFEFEEPETAREDDLKLVHTQSHVEQIKRDIRLYEVASLSVGGAIRASEIALRGEPAFGLIRPPGHHASPDSCWGFCYFNNIAIAIKRLIQTRRVKNVLIVDFDLHFGDGTRNAFAGDTHVVYHHMGSKIGDLESFLSSAADSDILAVSAGFDRGIADWGGALTDKDFEQIGQVLRRYSLSKSRRRRFAVLEGGYNHETLGQSILTFLRGFK